MEKTLTGNSERTASSPPNKEKRKRVELLKNTDNQQKQQHTDSGKEENLDESYCRTCNKLAEDGVIQCQ